MYQTPVKRLADTTGFFWWPKKTPDPASPRTLIVFNPLFIKKTKHEKTITFYFFLTPDPDLIPTLSKLPAQSPLGIRTAFIHFCPTGG
jgi:hypothetical protein